MIRFFTIAMVVCGFQVSSIAVAQPEHQIQWLTFEQLDDSLAKKPKNVFIDFVTDWCTYCRKMDQVVFTKAAVIEKLNADYYAVKMDAETTDTIYFDGQAFVNRQALSKRNGIHQIAELLGTRDGQFTPPTMIILDEDFNVQHRYFSYMNSKQLLTVLQ